MYHLMALIGARWPKIPKHLSGRKIYFRKPAIPTLQTRAGYHSHPKAPKRCHFSVIDKARRQLEASREIAHSPSGAGWMSHCPTNSSRKRIVIAVQNIAE